MNSKKIRIPPLVLSTVAARGPQASSPLFIRAPLSPFEESSSPTSSSSSSEVEIDDDEDAVNGFGSGSHTEPGPVLVRSESMPVARLTEDEDVDEEEGEEVLDDVDGFVVRVPVIDDDDDDSSSNPNPSPSSDGEEGKEDNVDLESFVRDRVLDDELPSVARVSSQNRNTSSNPSSYSNDDEGEAGDDQNPNLRENLDGSTILGGNSSVVERFEKPDGDGFANVDRVSSQSRDPNSDDNEGKVGVDQSPNLGVSLNEDRILSGNSNDVVNLEGDRVLVAKSNADECFENSKVEAFDEVDVGRPSSQNGFSSLDVDVEESNGGEGPRPKSPKMVLVEGENPYLHDSVESRVSGDNGDLDSLNYEVEILVCESKELSSIFDELVDSKPMEAKYDDIVDTVKEGVDKVFNHGEAEFNAVDAKRDMILGVKLNAAEKVECYFSDSIDGIDKENGNLNELNEQEDIVRSGSGEMNIVSIEFGSEPLEVMSNTIEMEIDEIEEDFKYRQLHTEAAETWELGDSNQNQKLKDKDSSLPGDYGKSDSSSCKFDEGDDGKLNEVENGVSNSLVNSEISETSFEISETSFDNPDAVIEIQIAVQNEKAVTRLEEASIVSEGKLKLAENGCLLDKSNTRGTKIMDQKAKMGEERHVSDEQMTQNSEEGPSSSRDCVHNINLGSGSDDEEGMGLYGTVPLLELLKTMASSSTIGNNTITTSNGGLGLQSLPTIITSPDAAAVKKPDNIMAEEKKKLHEQVELIRIKFLRLVHRLGYHREFNMADTVLYHLAHIEDMKDWKSSFQNARKKAVELEMEEKDKLDFSCNILVIGKVGVGKSATINSIFEEDESLANPFTAVTTSVRKFEGVIDGIKIQILDTPGLGASLLDQASNRRILSSVKKHMKRCPPDVVLYVDRLDSHTRDFNDLPLLRSIANTLGSSIWSNAIIALTHATKDPPEGPSGSSLSHEAFVAQRSHVVQQLLRSAVGDMRLLNPVALVENHPSCLRNIEGQKVLQNGSTWRPVLLLLCYSSKILSEAYSLPKVHNSSVRKQFRSRFRSPLMQFFLSSLLESKEHPKFPSSQGGNEDLDIDLDDFSDVENEEDEYDQLPPFFPLSKSQIAKLAKDHRTAYFAEYDYRVELLQKKQLKEEIKRLKGIREGGKNCQVGSSYDDSHEEFDHDPTAPRTVAPAMVLPPSFDSGNPVYRYRLLEPTSPFFTGFFLNNQCWDHDCGFDGVRLEKLLAVACQFPAEFSVRLRKDKKDFIINLDFPISAKHGETGSSLASFEVQTIGNLLSYCLRGETKFTNWKNNKTTVEASANFLGDTLATGLKLEDQVSIGKKVNLTVKTGAVQAEGDVAYGANLDVSLKKKDYPIGQVLATFGLSLFRCNGRLACGGTLQSEVQVGRNSKVAVLAGLNSSQNGQITIKTSSSEQIQIALLGLIPIAVSLFRKIWNGQSL